MAASNQGTPTRVGAGKASCGLKDVQEFPRGWGRAGLEADGAPNGVGNIQMSREEECWKHYICFVIDSLKGGRQHMCIFFSLAPHSRRAS